MKTEKGWGWGERVFTLRHAPQNHYSSAEKGPGLHFPEPSFCHRWPFPSGCWLTNANGGFDRQTDSGSGSAQALPEQLEQIIQPYVYSPFFKRSRPVGSGLALRVLQLDPWPSGSLALHDTLWPILFPQSLSYSVSTRRKKMKTLHQNEGFRYGKVFD